MLQLLANAGTPLVWFGLVYPFVGSFVVAKAETALLKRAGVLRSRAMGWNPVLVGNLVSTGFGVLLVMASTNLSARFLGQRPIERANGYVLSVWLLAFVVTVIVEAPFVAKAMGTKARSRRTLLASLAVNSVTYLGLFLVTWLLSRDAIGLKASVVPISRIEGSATGWVYYVPRGSTRIMRVRLDGQTEEATPYSLRDNAEDISIDSSDGRAADLVVFRGYDNFSAVARLGKAGQAAILPYQVAPDGTILPPKSRESLSYQPARTFQKPGPNRRETLDFDTFHWVWPDLGMSFRSNRQKKSYELALGSPFLSWNWRYATVLPDGRAIVAFGPQIVVVDIPTRRVAWLANGRSPAVLLDSPVR